MSSLSVSIGLRSTILTHTGPYDLAKQMGVEFGGKEHEEAISNIQQAVKRAGKKSSIFCGSGEQAAKRLEQGFDCATITQDNDLLFAEVGNQVKAAQKK